MNPLFDAAQAALALALDCLEADCHAYPRQLIETSPPVADCNTLAVVIAPARAHNGSCVGRGQFNTWLDIVLIRCCEPVGDLNAQGGYTPPSPDAITDAVTCLLRDAWAILECVLCSACEVLGTLPGVTACCNEVDAPQLMWGAPSGGCRSATVRIPIIVTTCCEPDEG